MTEPLQLLHHPGERDGAAATFDRVLNELQAARESVEIFMYVWRSDAIGNEVGRAVLDAAERGVRVRIIKDTGAFLFERIEMNRKSFFNRKLPALKRWVYRRMIPSFPDTFVQDEHDFAVGDALMAHPGVRIEWVNKTHTKYYIFDEATLLTGSINLEDRHRGYFDYMLALNGAEPVQRLRARSRGAVDLDAERAVEFYVNAHDAAAPRFEIRPRMLELIRAVRESIDVEMAYLGDESITEAFVEAARRGVRIRILFSKDANIGNEINYHTLRLIMRRASVEAWFTPKMIHSKMMIFDGSTVMMGSANLSVFSLRKAGEVNLELRDPADVQLFRAVFEDRLGRSKQIEGDGELRDYSLLKATLQQWHQKLNPN